MKTLLLTMFCAMNVSSLFCMEMAMEAQSEAANVNEARELEQQQSQISDWQSALTKKIAELEMSKQNPNTKKKELQIIAQDVLFYACCLHDHAAARIALDHGALINFKYANETSQTPLRIACSFFDKETEKRKDGQKLLSMLLQEHGRDITVYGKDLLCALVGSCYNGKSTVPLKILLEYAKSIIPELDINELRIKGSTALHIACEKGHLEHVQILCNLPELNPNVQTIDKEDYEREYRNFFQTALHKMVLTSGTKNYLAIARLLANKGASLECVDSESDTVLDTILDEDNNWGSQYECLALALGAQPETLSTLGKMFLPMASDRRNSILLGMLPFTDADSIYTNQDKVVITFCYEWAVEGCQKALKASPAKRLFAWIKGAQSLEDAKKFITKLTHDGANLNVKDGLSLTPFMWAAARGRIDLAEALYETRKIDVNAQDDFGDAALHQAARNGQPEMIAFLLRLPEIDTSIKNSTGLTAYKVAKNCLKWAPTKDKHTKVLAIFKELYEERARLALRMRNDILLEDEFLGTRNLPLEITHRFAQSLTLRAEDKKRLFAKKISQIEMPTAETQTPLP